ncbi:DUF5592 family protein [Limosilactobacillus gastricus]|uniref:DUF5592 family protein n=1 Tax=Limosilactobacillus gastricus TaxID=227942 RepID=UPI0026ECE1CE|nr:DUF5592 family protein [Limosilactobacillus gastricus]
MKEIVITPGVRSEIKLFSGFFIKDLLVVGIVMAIGLLLSQLFPGQQSINQNVFLVLTFILAIDLDRRPGTNPGKRNYEVIWFLLVDQHPKLFKSIGYYEFYSKDELWEMQINGNQRN